MEEVVNRRRIGRRVSMKKKDSSIESWDASGWRSCELKYR